MGSEAHSPFDVLYEAIAGARWFNVIGPSVVVILALIAMVAIAIWG